MVNVTDDKRNDCETKRGGSDMTTETKDRPTEVKYYGDDDSRAE